MVAPMPRRDGRLSGCAGVTSNVFQQSFTDVIGSCQLRSDVPFTTNRLTINDKLIVFTSADKSTSQSNWQLHSIYNPVNYNKSTTGLT